MASRTRIVCLVVLFAAVAVAVVHSQQTPIPVVPVPPPPPPVEAPPPLPAPGAAVPIPRPAEDIPPRAGPAPPPRSAPQFEIDPKTPETELLPAAPKETAAPVYLGTDVERVPELTLEAAPGKPLATEEWAKRTGHSLAKAAHLNGRKRDGFIHALLRERGDLAGLPFQIGDSRKGGRGKVFKDTVAQLRAGELATDRLGSFAQEIPFPAIDKETESTPAGEEHVQTVITALSQFLGGEQAPERQRRVRTFSAIPRAESTRQLARLAVFDPDRRVREAAIKALSVRREGHYTEVLVSGLRYPWPTVAERAAEAIVKLERRDLLPELVDLLEEADPRLPQTEKGEDKAVTFTRELVRVNHNTSCLLCHAPAEAGKLSADVAAAEVPVPSEALPAPAAYAQQGRGLLVRLDVTYLHQDFALLLPVKDAAPWPEMQRFDFLVRKRVLTDAEADDLRSRLETKEPGKLSPYHRAAVRALRDLTGHDLEAKAEAWRKLLKLPPRRES